MVAAHFHIGRVEPDIGPVAFQRPVEEGLHPRVDLLAQPADLALGDAGCAHGSHQIIDRAGRDALDIGLLDHRAQRFLGHPPRLEETRKVRALAQLGDAKLHRPGTRLPVPVAIAVALGEPIGRALAKTSAGPRANLHLHQPLGGEGDHLAQNVGVGGLLHKRAKVHHLVGHWRFLGLRLQFATRTYRKTANDRRKPLARYSAMKSALRERLAPTRLHHQVGHDPADLPQARRNHPRPRLCSFLALVLKKALEDRIAGARPNRLLAGNHRRSQFADRDRDRARRQALCRPLAPRPAASLALRAAGVALPPTVGDLRDY